MTPTERVTLDLTDQIEADLHAMRSEAALPEPASLQQARDQLDLATRRLRALEAQHNEVKDRLEKLSPPTFWSRLTGDDAQRRDLQSRSDLLIRKITESNGAFAKASLSLAIERKNYQAQNRRHLSDQAFQAKRSAGNVTVWNVAKILLSRHPGIAFCGTAHLLRLAAEVRSRHEDAPDDLDLWGETDLWGIPLQPRPKPLFP
jgi:hypothetical protein